MPASDDFIPIYVQHERQIRLYIKRLVYHASDAEDIMQAVAMVLWKKFDSYNPDYPFIPWAYKIAYNEVRNYYRKHAKKNNFFADVTLEQLAITAEKKSSYLEDLRFHLKDCLLELEDKERLLVEYRYCDDGKLKDLAERTGETPNALTKTLQRLRRRLYLCVHHRREA